MQTEGEMEREKRHYFYYEHHQRNGQERLKTVSTHTIVGGGGEFAVGGADGDLPHAVIGPRAAIRLGKTDTGGGGEGRWGLKFEDPTRASIKLGVGAAKKIERKW